MRLAMTRSDLWALLVIGTGITLLATLPDLIPTWVYSWNEGHHIPIDAPREANRVVSKCGFSIVIPKNWSVESQAFDRRNDCSSLFIHPNNGNRIPKTGTAISITKTSSNPILDPNQFRRENSKWTSGTFQGEPCWLETKGGKGQEKSNDPTIFWHTICFERNGEGYVIMYFVTAEIETIPPTVQSFLDTFRIEEATPESDLR